LLVSGSGMAWPPRCEKKKPEIFLRAQNDGITHLYFLFFMFFYTYICNMSF